MASTRAAPMPGKVVSVGLAQLAPGPVDPARSLEASLAAVRRLAGDGAQLAVLPELAVPGYSTHLRSLADAAEGLSGPAVEAWCELARELRLHICAGFCERSGARLFNSAVLVGPDGVLVHYRKLHLFATEKQTFAPGDLGLPVVDLPFGRVGVCICYDLRFVETVRALALRGAELICVPTAWIPGFDGPQAPEPGVLPTQAQGAILQANLSQVFLACASVAGERDGTHFLGSSLLVGPDGLARIGPMSTREAGTAVAEIDVADARRAQRRDPLITPREDRRTDVYRLKVEDQLL